MVLKIIDAPMGTGKSTAMMNWCEGHPEQRVIFVTPFLSEVERIKGRLSFFVPDSESESSSEAKLPQVKAAIESGKSVITTHSLFLMFTPDMAEDIRKYHYVLMIDESPDLIRDLSVWDDDKTCLTQFFCDVDEDSGRLLWKKEKKNYSGVFNDFKNKIDCAEVYSVPNGNLVWMFSYEILNAFYLICVGTYMFPSSNAAYYFRFHGYEGEFQKLYVTKDYKLTKSPVEYDMEAIRKLITIDESAKINQYDMSNNAYSKTWYEKRFDAGIFSRSLYHFVHVNDARKYKDLIWTTYKKYEYPIAHYKNFGRNLKKGFLSCSIRATNEFSDRHLVAYFVKRCIHPTIQIFLSQHGVKIDNDMFALSEMLQFIWRSAVRNGEPIVVLIPSARMHRLFQEWLDGKRDL